MVWDICHMVGLFWPPGVTVWSDHGTKRSDQVPVWSHGRTVWSDGAPVWSDDVTVWSHGRTKRSDGGTVWSHGGTVWSPGGARQDFAAATQDSPRRAGSGS